MDDKVGNMMVYRFLLLPGFKRDGLQRHDDVTQWFWAGSIMGEFVIKRKGQHICWRIFAAKLLVESLDVAIICQIDRHVMRAFALLQRAGGFIGFTCRTIDQRLDVLDISPCFMAEDEIGVQLGCLGHGYLWSLAGVLAGFDGFFLCFSVFLRLSILS